jgi:flagella basal body P-ring formation protein FlgA
MPRRIARLTMHTIAVLGAAALLAAPLPAQESANNGVAARTPRAMSAGSMRVSLAVASRGLQRGDTIRANDFTLVDSTITWRWSMPSADTARVQPGWVAQRAIAVGEVLRSPSVQPPAVITGGSVVKVIFRDGPVQVVLSGTAITSATLGAPVGVRIDRTRRIEGIAVAPNTVRIR